jgi:hypothetical protein
MYLRYISYNIGVDESGRRARGGMRYGYDGGTKKGLPFTCRLIYWSPEDYPNGQLLLGEPH